MLTCNMLLQSTLTIARLFQCEIRFRSVKQLALNKNNLLTFSLPFEQYRGNKFFNKVKSCYSTLLSSVIGNVANNHVKIVHRTANDNVMDEHDLNQFQLELNKDLFPIMQRS